MRLLSVFILVATSVALSDSIPLINGSDEPNVRLELKLTPVPGIAGAGTSILTVNGKGVVRVRELQHFYPGGEKSFLVRTLSPRQMERIETYIADARDGEIVTKASPFHCHAIASHLETITADNSNTLLRRAPNRCPRKIVYNVDPAAHKLVKQLHSLYQEYKSLSYLN